MSETATLSAQVAALGTHQDNQFRDLMAAISGFGTQLSAQRQSIDSPTTKVDTMFSGVIHIQHRTDRLEYEVQQLKAATRSSALMEDRLRRIHIRGVPIMGQITRETVKPALKRYFQENGVPSSITAMEDGKVCSLSVLHCGINKKVPGTCFATFRLLTPD